MKRMFILALAVPLVLGCATSGHKVDAAQVDAFQVGVATKDQVIAAFGRPTSFVNATDGSTHLVWSWAHASAFGGAKAEAFTFVFDPQGILIRKGGTNLDSHLTTE